MEFDHFLLFYQNRSIPALVLCDVLITVTSRHIWSETKTSIHLKQSNEETNAHNVIAHSNMHLQKSYVILASMHSIVPFFFRNRL